MSDLQSVKTILMERDGLPEAEAEEVIADFKEELSIALLDPDSSLDTFETLVEDWFGLEPDYLMEFLPL